MDNSSENTRFNRLIDGELSHAEYRDLLASLDDDPGGWRRCALAFLESQALAQELPPVRRSLDIAGKKAPDVVSAVTASRQDRGLQFLAIAASFVVAFGLGLLAPRFFSRAPQDSILTGNFHTQPDEPLAGPANGELQKPRNIGNLRLVVDDGEPSESRQVPVYEVEQDLDDYVRSASPPIGPELLDLLRRHGYDVQHEQQYVPAALEDGRQMIVPLDGYQITPVSRRY